MWIWKSDLIDWLKGTRQQIDEYEKRNGETAEYQRGKEYVLRRILKKKIF